MQFTKSATLRAAGIAVAFAIVGAGSATASSMITSAQIENGTIRKVDLTDYLQSQIARHAQDGQDGARGPKGDTGATGLAGAKGDTGAPGAPGANGTNGKDGLAGAIYRVENYKNGGGGSATVACADDPIESQKYTAIAGGVQGSNSGTTEKQDGFLVSSSFPGRMDWATGVPKANRLDGWIVFGNSQHTDTLKVWALCVPNTSIPTQVVDLDN